MFRIQTERLLLERFEHGDAPFIVSLLNQPSFLTNIGDKGVRDEVDARRYLDQGPLASYAQHGFGLFRVSLRDSATVVGMCGLIRRDTLDDVDLGYALLPEYWGRGYAVEAARASLNYGLDVLGLPRVVAIITPGNHASVRVVEKLGMAFRQKVRLEDEQEPIDLYATRG